MVKKAVILTVSTGILSVLGAVIGLVFSKQKQQERPQQILQRNIGSSKKRPTPSTPTFKLKNNNGMEVVISANGAAIQKLVIPDRRGKKADVVLGYESASEYLDCEPCPYFGVIVGRCANRIAKAQFTIDGESHKLLANNGENALHGGPQGLHKRVWECRELVDEQYEAVELRYDSPHGEEGYPGNLHVVVVYRLYRHRNELQCTVTATTDQTTPVNIAQHSYFNLGGHGSGTVLGHVVRMPSADHYTPVNPSSLIPTGEILPVNGTPYDFATAAHTIGERIAQVPGGYDHNYVLHAMGPQARFIVRSNGSACDKPKLAAVVSDPMSGRAMEVYTTAPGVQFYTGNFLDGTIRGKGGAVYPQHGGFCLETQGFPDAVNQQAFPSVLLQPQQTYVHDTVYRFLAE